MGHASLRIIALVVRQHNNGALTAITAEEKAFLRVAVAAIPRVTEMNSRISIGRSSGCAGDGRTVLHGGGAGLWLQ